jgi:hypothetical protein
LQIIGSNLGALDQLAVFAWEAGFFAAKTGAREAMEADDFDKVNSFGLAMKRQHKLMEDLRDRKIDLENSIQTLGEELGAWPTIQLDAPAKKGQNDATDVKEQQNETTTDEETLELAA